VEGNRKMKKGASNPTETKTDNENSKLLALTQALADPLRLVILQHLMSGAMTVSELIALTGESQSKVSNHLAILRESGLVKTTRQGRQIIYELKDLAVGQLIESLSLVAGTVPAHIGKSPSLIKARTCYDHLAGQLGVQVLDSLIEKQAITLEPDQAVLRLGGNASTVFEALNIDLKAVAKEKRKFAYSCLDWTERRPHLGGALGAVIWVYFMEQGWAMRQPGTRALILTEKGQQGLKQWLDLDFGDAL
jgi:DNA-binding transcriptional ArsR family regulator